MKYIDDVILSVKKEFLRRQEMRHETELKWQYNMNFLKGEQNKRINSDRICDTDKRYRWQQNKVFNHIAPVMELRMAKLMRIRPSVSVVPSSYYGNKNKAQLCQRVLNSIYEKINMKKIIADASKWSEMTGTVFYKLHYSEKSKQYCVEVVPPSEIYPDRLDRNDLSECDSVIHARPMSVSLIKSIYGVNVEGEKIGDDNDRLRAMVIEMYMRPTVEFPEGRLIIVAGNRLLYSNKLPFINGENGNRGFPFIRQCAVSQPGEIFGTSIIERLIPVQKAYNSVRNHRHELMSRMASGILAVEENSVDLDELCENGLYPGKILVYRQGNETPKYLEPKALPEDFNKEEERLLNEFSSIAGVSEMMLSSSLPLSSLSGTALSILSDMDESRMLCSYDELRNALRMISRQLLFLCEQFGAYKTGELSGSDIIITTENENATSPMELRSTALELMRAGIMDKDGKVDTETRNKILSLYGLTGLI